VFTSFHTRNLRDVESQLGKIQFFNLNDTMD
jgi:hypothetical protein